MALILSVFPLAGKGQQGAGYDIDAISKSVVQIVSPTGQGSGSIFHGSQYIVTNRHILEGQYEFTISVLEDINSAAVPKYKAELVGFSVDFDFGILRITHDLDGNPFKVEDNDSSGGIFASLDYPEEDYLGRRGDHIGILGYPGIGENELVYTTGIISSVNFDHYHDTRMPFWYRTNAEMSPGSSGGIAVNSKGEVIGLPTYVSAEFVTGGRLGNILTIQLINKISESEDFINNWDDLSPELWTTDYTILNYDLGSNYGEVVIDYDIGADPYFVDMIAGGNIDASYLEGDCIGFTTAPPGFRFFWEGDIDRMVIFFLTEAEDADPTLHVNLPDGSWVCNDDADDDTLMPMIIIDNPMQGQYDLWVGALNSSEFYEGTLMISDTGFFTENMGMDISDEAYPDYTLDPVYASLYLSEGFEPDPYIISVLSGGDIAVSSRIGPDCMGFSSKAPDFRLHWTGSTTNLRISFEADNPEEDTILIINTSNGDWICNDDAHSDTLNPLLQLDGYPEGQFDIWVASYYKEDFISGKLVITEL